VHAEAARAPEGLAGRPGVHDLLVDGHRVECEVDTDHLGDLLAHLGQFGIRALTSQPPTLEELFLRHYGDQLSELEDLLP
jgi:ABC-2 type transport system ATP-binding protein